MATKNDSIDYIGEAQTFCKKYEVLFSCTCPCRADLKDLYKKVVDSQIKTMGKYDMDFILDFCVWKKFNAKIQGIKVSVVSCLTDIDCKFKAKAITEELKTSIAEVVESEKKKKDAEDDKKKMATAGIINIDVLADMLEGRVSANTDVLENKYENLSDYVTTLTNKCDALQKALDEAVKNKISKTVTYEIKINDKIKKIEGHKPHKMFYRVLKTICTYRGTNSVTNLKEGQNLYLYGEAGTGKNIIGADVAKSLSMDFHYCTTVTQEYQLTGFVDANGTFHETELYQAMKNGGVFFMDELDASTSEVLIKLNGLLANGYMVFANNETLYLDGEKTKIIAAGNTLGHGASEDYSSRCVLDGATLDRFIPIHIDYDEDIEIVNADGDSELVKFAHALRKAKKEVGIQFICSYRSLKNFAINYDSTKEDLQFALYNCFFKMMPKDDLRILLDATEASNNKYYIESKELLNTL